MYLKVILDVIDYSTRETIKTFYVVVSHRVFSDLCDDVSSGNYVYALNCLSPRQLARLRPLVSGRKFRLVIMNVKPA